MNEEEGEKLEMAEVDEVGYLQHTIGQRNLQHVSILLILTHLPFAEYFSI